MVCNKSRLGEPLIPFTFPTLKFSDAYFKEYFKRMPNTKIDRLHDAYGDIVKELGPYIPPVGAVFTEDQKEYYKNFWNAMILKSGYEKFDVLSFLTVLYNAAKSGFIENKWWSMSIPQTSMTSKVENIVKKTTESIPANPFDWAANTLLKLSIPVVLVGGIVIYFLIKPYSPKRKG